MRRITPSHDDTRKATKDRLNLERDPMRNGAGI